MAAPAYHNKALPPGAVLREWEIEDVLGAGGFAIVYRAKNVYFGDSVAIKEYFPSGITDRVEGITVTPTDSSSEEAYRYGLKKFVDEAKILWNLSRPTRHPNLISVRSLFEINGTAYIVMDYERGQPLSRQLRQGRKFDEQTLWRMFYPILQGLERAHKAGVYHRDIKPANILVDQSDHPVLIDFGSARFETAKGTHTRLTFYTPPYAAIEQYVKSLPTGPWTDIYALGVTLYQCITGKKPAEATDRSFGGKGEALADGDWPGFSKAFLAWVDRAMIVHPTERPQSLTEWLNLRGEVAAAAPAGGANWDYRQEDEGGDDDTGGHEAYDDDNIPEPEGLRAADEDEQRTVVRPLTAPQAPMPDAGADDATRLSAPHPVSPALAPVVPAPDAPPALPRKMRPGLIAAGLAALLAAGAAAFFLRGGSELPPPAQVATPSPAPAPAASPLATPAPPPAPPAPAPQTAPADAAGKAQQDALAVADIRDDIKQTLAGLSRQSGELGAIAAGLALDADASPQAAADLRKLQSLSGAAHAQGDQLAAIATSLPANATPDEAAAALEKLRAAGKDLQASLTEARRLRQSVQSAQAAAPAAIRQIASRNAAEQAAAHQQANEADRLVAATAGQADKIADHETLLAPLRKSLDQIKGKVAEADAATPALDAARTVAAVQAAYDQAAAARAAAQSAFDRLKAQNKDAGDRIAAARLADAAKSAPAAAPAAAPTLAPANPASACPCPADMSARRCAEWKVWNCK